MHDLSNLRELVHVRRHVDIATRGALVRFAQKTDEEDQGGRQRSGHQHGRVIAIIAIAPNGEMDSDSVADANGT